MDTPICDFVNKYIDSDFSRFHMPGHKGKEFIGCERQDITEIDGADVLSHADGIIKKSQEMPQNFLEAEHHFIQRRVHHSV